MWAEDLFVYCFINFLTIIDNIELIKTSGENTVQCAALKTSTRVKLQSLKITSTVLLQDTRLIDCGNFK